MTGVFVCPIADLMVPGRAAGVLGTRGATTRGNVDIPPSCSGLFTELTQAIYHPRAKELSGEEGARIVYNTNARELPHVGYPPASRPQINALAPLLLSEIEPDRPPLPALKRSVVSRSKPASKDPGGGPVIRPPPRTRPPKFHWPVPLAPDYKGTAPPATSKKSWAQPIS